MPLAFGAGQDGHRPDSRHPAASEAQEPTAKKVRGEVLLADTHLPAGPALADLSEGGEEHLLGDRVERQPSEHLVEDAVGALLVELLDRLEKLCGGCLGKDRRTTGLGRLRSLPFADDGGGLSGREPLVDQASHRPGPFLVGRRVEAEAALRPLGLEHAVAALPCPQRVHPDAASPAQLTDPKQGRRRAGASVL